MLHKLTSTDAWNYHVTISWIMVALWVLFSFLGYYFNKNKKINDINKISIVLIIFSIFQEILDYLNRIFLDPNYMVSWQRDLPFHFCHIAFYFSVIVIYNKVKNSSNTKKDSNQLVFLFESAYLLGLSGALQGIFTPDFENIHNFIGILCGQLQHSLIILNVFWLMFAYGMKLRFKGAIYTYLFVNLIAPIAILLNYILGKNSNGDSANYLYVMELPKVDNFLVNFVSDKPFPDFIFYIQPLIITYILILYIPFFIIKHYQSK